MKVLVRNTLRIAIILIIIFATIPSNAKASWWGDVIKNGDIFINDGKKNRGFCEDCDKSIMLDKNAVTCPKCGGKNITIEQKEVTDAEVVEVVTTLYYTLMALGTIVSVGYGGVMGIKFMAASAEDKAKVKESMVPFVIGMGVIFGSFLIWKIAVGVFSAM